MSVANNFKEVKENINLACKRCGRNPDEIEIVTVTKSASLGQVEEAYQTGLRIFGENRVDELLKKKNTLGFNDASWHLIGHLQRNKVKKIIGQVELIQSLDSMRLAKEIAMRAQERKIEVRCLVEVNVGKEPQKYGLQEEEIDLFLKEAALLKGIKIEGLMTVAPLGEEKVVRPVFKRLSQLFTFYRQNCPEGIEMQYLSMGMSSDYIIAVEEGANMLRLGTAIFKS